MFGPNMRKSSAILRLFSQDDILEYSEHRIEFVCAQLHFSFRSPGASCLLSLPFRTLSLSLTLLFRTSSFLPSALLRIREKNARKGINIALKRSNRLRIL